MYAYELKPIAEFAEQLKRGPVRLRLRQLLSIDFLLSVIEAERESPFDFVQHALTGYRTPLAGRNEESPLLSGGPLRSDLATLAEDLSEQAGVLVDAWPGALCTVSELAARFDVSTKTIFRWRRRGLVGWRFRGADRRQRLLFTDACVRRFVAGNADVVTRGASFSQLTRAERQQIVARANELVTAGERTVNAVAKTISAESGRAVETIRLILKNHDEAHPRAGLFNRPMHAIGADDQRLAVWEAYEDGASVATLAARFGRPTAWVYRVITEMRARALKAQPIEFVPSAEFAERGDALLRDPALAAPHDGSAVPARRIPADLPPYLRQLFHLPLLTPAGEVALFRKMNYLRYKADRLREGLEPETATARELDQIEALLDQANAVKNQIVQANLRLVVNVAKRHASPQHELFELVSDGNVSLMRAVDKFDYSRGFKFSTYASWALMKNFARSIPEQRHHRDRYQTGRDELLGTVAGPTVEEPEDDFLAAVRARLDRMLGTLDEREQAILRQRYGLAGRGEAQTLEQIGRRFGVSKERIRQIEARAMA